VLPRISSDPDMHTALRRPSARPGILSGPPARTALRHGIDMLADIVRSTLGPTPRTVAVQDVLSGRPIEVLDDAATILRRIIEIPDHYVNMGAMMLRHATWKTFEAVGDGGATTAVLFQAIMRQLAPYVAAGGDPIALRRHLEHGLGAATAALRGQARTLDGPDAIARAAETLCHDPELATMLGEIFDIIGTDGYLQVEDGYTAGLERTYVEGVHWGEGYVSPYFNTDELTQEARLDLPMVLISDLRLTQAEELLPLLDRLVEARCPGLLLIADEVSGGALHLLLTNHRQGVLRTVAVRAPSHEPHRARILEDMAILTGGRVVTKESGQRAAHVSLSDLGRVRQAWANDSNFGFYGGDADPTALRRRIAEVKAELGAATSEDDQEHARRRLGKLVGGVAILYVGALTAGQQQTRKDLTRRTATALRLALRDGVAPGGGAAYVACQEAVQVQASSLSTDGRVVARALATALQEPLAVIAANAGYDQQTVVARVKTSPPWCGFDALTGQFVDMWAASIVDPVPVLQTALESAVSGAAMALASDVLVHMQAPLTKAKP